MARQNERFLKNMKTGVIFPFSQLLHENRADLLECDKHGNLTHVAKTEEQAPFLLNPVTGKIVGYTPNLGSRLGWIPVQNAEHAEQVMADLGGSDIPNKPQGLKPPDQVNEVAEANEELDEAKTELAQTQEELKEAETEVDEEQADLVERLKSLEVDKMQRQSLGKLVKELDEDLDVNEGELSVVREQVQVLVNNKLHSLKSAA